MGIVDLTSSSSPAVQGMGKFKTIFADVDLTALTTTDTFEILQVPAGAIMLGLGVKVLTKVAGSTVFTLGAISWDSVTLQTGLALAGVAVGTYEVGTVAAPAASSTATAGTASDVTLAVTTITGTCTAGKIRVFAHIALGA
jgi:hypothetical protein